MKQFIVAIFTPHNPQPQCFSFSPRHFSSKVKNKKIHPLRDDIIKKKSILYLLIFNKPAIALLTLVSSPSCVKKKNNNKLLYSYNI